MIAKYIKIALCTLLVMVSCERSDEDQELRGNQNNYLVHVSSTYTDSRVTIDGATITWKIGDTIEIVEVGSNNTLLNKLTYNLVPSSITEDGKSADFTGTPLTIGKRYKAFHGSISSSGSDFIATTTGDAEKVLLLSSNIETIEGSQQPSFLFKHEMSLLEVEITLANSFELDRIGLKSLAFTSPVNSFVEYIKLGADNCSPYTRSEADRKRTINYNYTNTYLTKNSTTKIRIPLYWNSEISEVEGNFELTLASNEYNIPTFTVPAKVLTTGKLYKAAVTITPEEKMSDEELLWQIYEEMNLKDWPSINWSKDLSIYEWNGVGVDSNKKVNYLYLNWWEPTEGYPDATLSDKLFELTNLQSIYLYGPVTGNLDKLGNLAQLQNFVIRYTGSATGLTGEIPSDVSKLTLVNYFYLYGHSLSGSIPESFGELNKLKLLYIINSKISGKIPNFLADKLTQYDGVSLALNNLTGDVPSALQQHAKWPYVLKSILNQNGTGLNLKGVSFPFPHFIDEDIVTGNRINSSETIRANKYTAMLSWRVSCPISNAFIPILQQIESKYKNKGFSILTTYWNGSSFESEGGYQYMKEKSMTWPCTKTTPAGIYPETGFRFFPYVIVADQEGQIVFDYLLTSPSDNQNRLEAFLLEKLGPGDEPTDDRYVSTDYSKDGEVIKLQSATVAGNGVDIILMGDGFVDRDMQAGGKYESRMHEAMEHLFSIEPMKSLRGYYNVYGVKVVSQHEEVKEGNSTKLESRFGEGTYIEGNIDLIFTYAQKKEGADLTKAQIVVVLNSPKYAGTCWSFTNGMSIAFCPYVGNSSEQFSQIIHHEAVGHGIGKLLDEYIYNNSAITAEYITQFNTNKINFGMGYNLTIDPEKIPWQHFIGHPNYKMVGLYEGGYFFAYGVWRAEQNSCMNNNVPYFNGPSREEIVRRTLTKAGETFTWEGFLALDKYVPFNAARSAWQNYNRPPLAPPVLVDWPRK